jgi:hypothetical protein
MQLPGLMFGSGVALAAPQPSSGNPAPNPTPLALGVLQNIKLTLGADIKSLYGIDQWAVDTAIGKRSIKGSFEFAQISNLLMSQLFFGDGTTAGTVDTTTFPGEAHTVPASSTYTVTVTNAADVPLVDYGVTYQNTGVPLVNVGTGSLSAAGQYKVNLTTGVYTFDSADASAAVYINYSWTPSPNTANSTLTAASHPMGYGPIIALNLVFPYEGGGLGFYLPNVRLGKIDIATKLEDYTMYTTDYEGFAGPNGVPFVSYQAF